MTDRRGDLLRRIFAAALAAADPGRALPAFLPPRPEGRLLVLGAGKASARMAQALEAAWGPCEGLVSVPRGARLPTRGIELIEAAHPVPDEASEQAARRALAMAASLKPEDTLVALISGGGSALLAAPAEGLTLADKQAVARALLASGAPIDQMNLVRQQLSAVKGGRLAEAAGAARILTFVVSDIPGDDPAFVASGPTVAPKGSRAEAKAILRRFGVTPPAAVARLLDQPEAPRPPAPRGEVFVIASAQGALEAGAKAAAAAGYATLILGDALEGEAREMGHVIGGIALQALRHGQPAPPPVALISGGEATVSVTGAAGRGGRCSEFLLALALAVGERPEISALACDTDGRDGSEDNAGAIWRGAQAFDRSAALAALAGHDAYGFFAATGGLVETGPTHTNVNDFRVVLIDRPEGRS